MRRAAKIDVNQPIIVDTFRKLGWSWMHCHELGKGRPDGIAGKNGFNILVEIKDGSLPPSARKLTADETKFHKEWRGDIKIIASIDDVIKLNSGYQKVFELLQNNL